MPMSSRQIDDKAETDIRTIDVGANTVILACVERQQNCFVLILYYYINLKHGRMNEHSLSIKRKGVSWYIVTKQIKPNTRSLLSN
jgi:hypothetical protein